ncbi:MAG: DNA polymerase III subunit beta [Pseudomonadota bacterium]|nr:DNA polymerase III subunit beta [Pseudomonadota bacterium]
MKVIVERVDLLKAMSRAQSIVERRTTIPILANVLIEADESGLNLRTTDLDIEIVERVKANVEHAGPVTVGAHTLHDIVRKLPDGASIQLSSDHVSSRLEVRAGRSRFLLSTLPREDFPMMATAEYDSSFSISSKTLQRLFEKSKFAMSTEETRYYLNGVFFHIYKAEGQRLLRAVATDGHRLAQIDAVAPPELTSMPGVIVPRKTVGELRMMLEAEEEVISVSVSDTKIRFSTAQMALTSKVIDGTFPDYTRVIPKDNKKELKVDAAQFSQSVDRVSTISSERARAVKLNLSDDKLVLSVNSPESGAADEELSVSYGDEELEIGFNARYLQEISAQVDSGDAVFLFNAPSDPVLMTEASDSTALYVVMPMRV